MTPPLISVCILAGHSPALFADCLDSLAAQENAPPFELIIGGRHEAASLAVASERFPDAKICDQDGGNPGAARNALISRAVGELLLFLDDDVTVSSDLLRRLADLASEHPEVAVFGGPNDTPPDSSRFQGIQGAVLSSLVGSGPVSRRYGARHPGPADERWFTLCNLAVRRDAMLPFVSDLVCAEENALLAELHADGRLMRYEPTLLVYHTRRATWTAFARQMFKYGRGRGQLLARSPGTLRAAFVLPSLLLAYAGVVAVVALSGGRPSMLLLSPIVAYGAVVLAGGSWIALTLRWATAAPTAVGLILTIHGCYGAGVLRGMFSRNRSAQSPAQLRATESGTI